MLVQAECREDESDLTTRDHADTNEQPVTGRTDQPDDRGELAKYGDDQQQRRRSEHGGLDELTDVGIDADLQKEHRNEKMSNRRQFAPDAIG